MMKRQRFVLVLGCVILLFQACGKSTLTVLSGTKWQLVEFIDRFAEEVHNYPKELDDYTLYFDDETTFSFPDGCNYRRGVYNLGENNTMVVSSLGPGTAMGCGALSTWESRVVRFMKQQPINYDANANKLTIANEQGVLHFKRIR